VIDWKGVDVAKRTCAQCQRAIHPWNELGICVHCRTPEQTAALAKIRNARKYAANRDRWRADAAAYRAANPGAVKALNTARYRKNRVERLAYAAERYASDPERFKAKAAAYRDENQEKIYALNAARRARVRGVATERVCRSVVWTRDGGICHLCRTPADAANWHMDHVVPIDKGGVHCYANCAVSHPFCNLSKHTDIVSADLARLSEALSASGVSL